MVYIIITLSEMGATAEILGDDQICGESSIKEWDSGAT